MARIDFLRENSTGKFFNNEINTIPGFTSNSMFSELIDQMIELALERHAEKKATRFTR
jgi:D-alanine-D-alanine ligase